MFLNKRQTTMVVPLYRTDCYTNTVEFRQQRNALHQDMMSELEDFFGCPPSAIAQRMPEPVPTCAWCNKEYDIYENMHGVAWLCSDCQHEI